jgi:hypothetical protein
MPTDSSRPESARGIRSGRDGDQRRIRRRMTLSTQIPDGVFRSAHHCSNANRSLFRANAGASTPCTCIAAFGSASCAGARPRRLFRHAVDMRRIHNMLMLNCTKP